MCTINPDVERSIHFDINLDYFPIPYVDVYCRHVDWLDEFTPYSFRQAQVSFSSRLPHAFPVPDARCMEGVPLMYCNYSKMDIKSAMKLSENDGKPEPRVKQSSAATGKSSPGQNDNMLIPNVLMISKHSNGSLNQWQISFSEESKFKTVLSVAHVSRACGHRFRTTSATCHPALPLLITTSQHQSPAPVDMSSANLEDYENVNQESGIINCSELILWRVDPVGPLSKSGGIVELAKINSTKKTAFSSVAWVPTLLPRYEFCQMIIKVLIDLLINQTITKNYIDKYNS